MFSASTLKGKAPKIRLQAIIPKEQRSQAEQNGFERYLSSAFSERISGAIYPIVPHLSQIWFPLIKAERPKSARTHFESFSLINIFQGLRSLCITLLSSRYLRASRTSFMMVTTVSPLRVLLFLMNSSKVPPDKYSVTRQMRFQVSQTPSYWITFGCERNLNVRIQFYKAYWPLNYNFCPSLEKTLAAHLYFVKRCSIKYTVAKAPFPSRFIGLKKSLKPLWEITVFSLQQRVYSCSLSSLYKTIYAVSMQMTNFQILDYSPCVTYLGTILQLVLMANTP